MSCKNVVVVVWDNWKWRHGFTHIFRGCDCSDMGLVYRKLINNDVVVGSWRRLFLNLFYRLLCRVVGRGKSSSDLVSEGLWTPLDSYQRAINSQLVTGRFEVERKSLFVKGKDRLPGDSGFFFKEWRTWWWWWWTWIQVNFFFCVCVVYTVAIRKVRVGYGLENDFIVYFLLQGGLASLTSPSS